MKKIISIILLFSVFLAGGCVELRETTRIMTIAMVELLRLPVYCLRLPFQILQSLGPIIQASVRSAANVAPLLLLIERRVPKDSMFAEATGSRTLEERMESALSAGAPVSLLLALEDEISGPSIKRFVLIESPLIGNPRVMEHLNECFGGDCKGMRCLFVDGEEIFSQSDRFLGICRRMKERGDALFCLTTFNGEIETVTGTPEGTVPDVPEDRRLFFKWDSAVIGAEEDAHREG